MHLTARWIAPFAAARRFTRRCYTAFLVPTQRLIRCWFAVVYISCQDQLPGWLLAVYPALHFAVWLCSYIFIRGRATRCSWFGRVPLWAALCRYRAGFGSLAFCRTHWLPRGSATAYSLSPCALLCFLRNATHLPLFYFLSSTPSHHPTSTASWFTYYVVRHGHATAQRYAVWTIHHQTACLLTAAPAPAFCRLPSTLLRLTR